MSIDFAACVCALQSEPSFHVTSGTENSADSEANERTRRHSTLRPRNDDDANASVNETDEDGMSIDGDSEEEAEDQVIPSLSFYGWGSLFHLQHNETCEICKESSRPKELLCCDDCPRVYHLNCLDPPLKKFSTWISERLAAWMCRVPKGDWSCPQCQERWKMQSVERILHENEEEGKYYVKWKNFSYRHCSWIPKATFQEAVKSFSYLRSKIRSFELKEEEVHLPVSYNLSHNAAVCSGY